MHRTRSWRRLMLLGAVAVLLAPTAAYGDVHENRELNFILEIPVKWSWLPERPEWEKMGIADGAIRRLDERRDGQAARGEGGRAHLASREVEEGRTLDDLAKDPDVRAFLLNRFDSSPSGWPDVEMLEDVLEGDTPLVVLRADGVSPNLDGRECATRAVMLLTITKGRLLMLRLYAWHTEFDDEGLKDDLDFIEVNFTLFDPTARIEGGSEAPPPPDSDEPEVLEGDEGEEKVFEDPEMGWRLVKPRRIRSVEIDKDRYPDAVAWFMDNDEVGFYQVVLTVFRKGRQQDGLAVPDADLRAWMSVHWWPNFVANHPEGPLRTYKWPRRTATGSFITLPDFEKEIMVFEDPERRPAAPSSSDMVRMRVLEKVKGRLGRERVNEGWRGAMEGLFPGVGKDLVLRFAWGTARHSYEMTVSIARGGIRRWGDELRQLLESIEIIEP